MSAVSITLPAVVIVVGPSGAGKTAFSEHWRALFPHYGDIDDLPVIREYLDLDRIVSEADDIALLRDRLSKFEAKAEYISDLARLYLRETDPATETRPRPRYCSRLSPSAMEITSPVVWDESAARLARSLRGPQPLLVQIARGHDRAYLQRFGIEESAVYERTLGLFINALDESLARNIAVVHVTADFESRSDRNERRRAITGQHVPQKVMEEVFTRDVFRGEYIDDVDRAIRRGILRIAGRALPMVTIDNSSRREALAVSLFLTDAASRAMQYFVGSLNGAPGVEQGGFAEQVATVHAVAPTPLRALEQQIHTNPPRGGTKLLLVAHLLDTTVQFIERLALVYDVAKVVAVPYSTNRKARESIQAMVPVAAPKDIPGVASVLEAECKELLRSQPNPVLIQDVGGYAVQLASSERFRRSNLLGIVEDTNHGHWKYEKAQSLFVPVVSIAQSRLKDIENTYIGHSVVHALENILRSEFHQPLGGRRVLVMGYGKIGRAACTMLRGRSAVVSVWDVDPIARAQARLDGYHVGARSEALGIAEVILGASGHTSVSVEDLQFLHDGVVLASGSSKAVEFDIEGIREASDGSKDLSPVVRLHHVRGASSLFVLYGGQPINFLFGSSLGGVLDAVFTGLYESGRLIEDGSMAPGLHHVPRSVEESVVATWEKAHGNAPG